MPPDPAPEPINANPARAPAGAPVVRALDRAACEAVLARNQVGRLSYALHDRVDIEPLHYVFDAGWLYARSAPGHKLETLAHNRWVTFEVDEVEAVSRWRSVVARGAVELLDPEGSPRQQEAWARAVALLRRVVPGTGTSDDPAPHRAAVIRVRVDEVTGREAVPAK